MKKLLSFALLLLSACAQESSSRAPEPQAAVNSEESKAELIQAESDALKIAAVEQEELSPAALEAGEEYNDRIQDLFSDAAELIHTAETSARFPINAKAHFIAGLGAGRNRCCDEFGRSFSVGHKGVDWGAKMGSPIVAVWSGRVVYASVDPLGGNVVKVMHPNGMSTYYAHMRDRALVKKGQLVKQGQQLGVVGMSGNAKGTVPHLHFELRRGGSVVDPLKFIAKKN